MKLVFLALMLSMFPSARAENNALCTLHAYGYFDDPHPYCRQYEGQTYICVSMSQGKLVRLLCPSEYKEPCIIVKA